MASKKEITILLALMCAITAVKGDVQSTDVVYALEQIEKFDPATCFGGYETVIKIPVNYHIWDEHTHIATKTSNFLSLIIQRNKGSLDSISDESLFNDLIKNNIIGQSAVFGSAIALESGVYSNYDRFAPYAHITNDKIVAFDPSVFYNYDDKETEWYYVPKTAIRLELSEINTETKLRSGIKEDSKVLIAGKDDGHWTRPYFDCGAGNRWMVTFSSPIFGRNEQSKEAEFKGVSIIDINLSNMDIDQCDPGSSNDNNDDIFFGVFKGTHKCQPTTECKFKPGAGFRTGGYDCVCQVGYYSPNSEVFNGEDVENAVADNADMTQFHCIPCPPGDCNSQQNRRTVKTKQKGLVGRIRHFLHEDQ